MEPSREDSPTHRFDGEADHSRYVSGNSRAPLIASRYYFLSHTPFIDDASKPIRGIWLLLRDQVRWKTLLCVQGAWAPGIMSLRRINWRELPVGLRGLWRSRIGTLFFLASWFSSFIVSMSFGVLNIAWTTDTVQHAPLPLLHLRPLPPHCVDVLALTRSTSQDTLAVITQCRSVYIKHAASR